MSPDIYQYEDYRLFLKDAYQSKLDSDKDYSARVFAREAGFTNPGFLNDVIKGRRTLSLEARKKMARVFDLKSKEAEFFNLLVEYGQCKNPDEKSEIFKRILFRRSRSSFARLNPALTRYYQDYRYPLIRSSLEVFSCSGDFEALGNFLVPSLSPAVVRRCVEDLVLWGLVQINAKGYYEVTSKFVEPPLSLRESVRQLNREWILQAAEALELFRKEERHISTMLLNVSRERQAEIQRRIDKFRTEIFQLIEDDDCPEVTLQLNLQFFPRTGKKEFK